VGAPAEVRVVLTEADLTEDDRAAISTLAHAQHERGTASPLLTGGGILEKVFGAVGDSAGHDASSGARSTSIGATSVSSVRLPDRNELPARRLMLDRLQFDPAPHHPMPVGRRHSRTRRMLPPDTPSCSTPPRAATRAVMCRTST
jgi:hypothetical protein